MRRPSARTIRLVAAALGAAPALALGLLALRGALGANPIEEVTHATGNWALRFLLLTLAVTPLRRVFGLAWVAPLRRTFGLTAFAYASLHVATFVGLDHLFDWGAMLEDALERRYVTVGLAAFLVMLPLAATSTNRMVRRLGRRWVQLHRLCYAAAALAVLHYLWLVKADLRAPLAYTAVLALLLGWRVRRRLAFAPRADASNRARA